MGSTLIPIRKVGVAALFMVAALLFIAAGALVLYAWAVINNLWADYEDSPDWLYIGLGGSALLAASVFAGFGAWTSTTSLVFAAIYTTNTTSDPGGVSDCGVVGASERSARSGRHAASAWRPDTARTAAIVAAR